MLEVLDDYADDMAMIGRSGLLGAVEKSGMTIITGANVTEITDSGVVYEKDGQTITITADSAFYAVGMRCRERTYFELYDKAPFVTLIGDAKKVGKVDGAIHSGYFAAMAI